MPAGPVADSGFDLSTWLFLGALAGSTVAVLAFYGRAIHAWTPPAPRTIQFPAIRLLRDLTAQEETPARTPWWLLLLRLIVAALIILALAGPLLNPRAALPGGGPLLLVVDNGWAEAATGSPLIEAGEKAKTEKKGIFGDDPRKGAPVAPPPDPPADNPLDPI